MRNEMSGIWFIANSGSGSFDAATCEALADRLGATRRITLPDDDLPDAAEANGKGADRIAIFTGDGTIAAAVEALEGWKGELLILPGGTMNLLSKKLHGEADAPTIVERVTAGAMTLQDMPMLKGEGLRSLVGVIAGPTSAWGDVREAVRKFDLRVLADAVPEALRATFGDDLVSLKGDDREFQAIFLDATETGVEALGVSASNAGELAQHGLAWLQGNFLGGPSVPLGFAPEYTICGGSAQDGEIGLLVDGERASAHAPCTFALTRSPIRFIATRA